MAVLSGGLALYAMLAAVTDIGVPVLATGGTEDSSRVGDQERQRRHPLAPALRCQPAPDRTVPTWRVLHGGVSLRIPG